VVVLIVGGPSGSGLEEPTALHELAAALGIADVVRFLPPQPAPSSCTCTGRRRGRGTQPQRVVRAGRAGGAGLRTPVVAAEVGGLPVAVQDGLSGVLCRHAAADWPPRWPRWRCARLPREASAGAVQHAERFSWDRSTDALLATYADAAAEYRAAVGLRKPGR